MKPDLQTMFTAIANMMGDENVTRWGNMTLGGFIIALMKCDPSSTVTFDSGQHPGKFDSYRGYYRFLALGRDGKSPVSVADLLTAANSCVGQTFEGYKGGDFRMDEGTALWAAEYGDCGPGIVGIEDQGAMVVIKTAPCEEN